MQGREIVENWISIGATNSYSCHESTLVVKLFEVKMDFGSKILSCFLYVYSYDISVEIPEMKW